MLGGLSESGTFKPPTDGSRDGLLEWVFLEIAESTALSGTIHDEMNLQNSESLKIVLEKLSEFALRALDAINACESRENDESSRERIMNLAKNREEHARLVSESNREDSRTSKETGLTTA